MPTLVLAQPIDLPVRALRETLSRAFRHRSWQIGDSMGEDHVTLRRPQTIVGRQPAGGDPIMICVEQYEATCRPANGSVPPPHTAWVSIAIHGAEREQATLCMVAMACGLLRDRPGAYLQMMPGANWLGTGEAPPLQRVLEGQPDITLDDLLRNHGTPERFDAAQDAAPQAPAAPAVPSAPEEDTRPRGRDGKPLLASFSLLLDGDVFIDWQRIDEAMNVVDPDGNWRAVASPGGMGFVTGRTMIRVIWAPMPIEPHIVEGGYARSHWFDGDPARIARHRQYITISADTADDFETRIAIARVITILIGMIAQLPQVSAVCNHEVSTIFSPKQAIGLVGVLSTGELPIQLWTWTAPDSMADGNVSLTTGGMEPLVGFEVEVWNSPHPVSVVGEKMSGVLRYLLINGPSIAHGDTIGTSADDQSVRCFYGDSRANRSRKVKAMFLEIDTARVAAPRPDLPPHPTVAPAAPPAPPIRRVGGFGRKGL